MDIISQEQPKLVSLKLAAGLTLVSAFLVFIAFFGKDHGLANLPKIVRYPEVFQNYILQAIGGSLALPTLNVLLISAFKSKRNPSTRRRIFTAWALVIIAVETITIISL